MVKNCLSLFSCRREFCVQEMFNGKLSPAVILNLRQSKGMDKLHNNSITMYNKISINMLNDACVVSSDQTHITCSLCRSELLIHWCIKPERMGLWGESLTVESLNAGLLCSCG